MERLGVTPSAIADEGYSSGRLLHLGCGRSPLPSFFPGIRETRFDIDPSTEPDIVGSIVDLSAIGDNEFDIVYSSHVMEHIFEFDVVPALKESLRVLKPNGCAIVNVLNLEGVLPDFDVVYESPAGPITGHDMYYGKASMVKDNPHMAHRTGFTCEKLKRAFGDAGFRMAIVKTLERSTILGIGVK